MLNGLDLFSGGGWLTEALADWVRPVAYCENDDFAQAVLLSRIFRNEIPKAPIWDDVRTLRGGMLPTQIDIIYGGFPCQGHSLAGSRKRMADKRSQLFWEIVRLVEETKAPFVFLENVWPGIRRSIPTIRATLESLGYKCRDGHLAASDVGLPHRRERWFLLAYSHTNGKRQLQQKGTIEDIGRRPSNVVEKSTTTNPLRERRRIQPGRWLGASGAKEIHTLGDVAQRPDTNPAARESRAVAVGKRAQSKQSALASALEKNDWDAIAAFFCGVDHGHPYRGKRLGVLGNSVPWIQYRKAFEILMGLI